MTRRRLLWVLLLAGGFILGNLGAPVSILAGTTQPGAEFKISELVVPAEVYAGDKFTISATVTNSASNDGNYEATLKINNVKEATSVTNVPPRGVKVISFSLAKSEPGNYNVDLDGLTGSFSVISKPSAPARTGITSLWLIIGIATAAVVALLIVLRIISRRRSHSRQTSG